MEFKDITTDKSKMFHYNSGEHIFFTSDTHFNHANIIKFCGRPFNSVEEMNDELIRRWNEKVGPDDIVFHLGDFAWGGSEIWNSILSRLNGHIHLIVGNHDEKNLRQNYAKYFDSVTYQKHIYVENVSIYLNHYPFLAFGGAYKEKDACWELFGHVHSSRTNTHKGKDEVRLKHLFPTQYDVGVDNNNFEPISFREIKEIIKEQQRQANMNWFEKLVNKIRSKIKTHERKS